MDITNTFIIIFLIGAVLNFALDMILETIDYRHRKKVGRIIPAVLKDYITQEDLDKTCLYEDTNYKFYLIQNPISTIFSFVLLFLGFYPFVYERIWALTNNSFLSLFLFVILVSIPGMILNIPFELYDEFVIEKRFGFSTMTKKLWILDKIKNMFVSLLLMIPLLFALSFLLQKASSWWWLLLGGIYVIFSLLIAVIYPMFIAPLFNKFSPLQEGELKTRLENLLQKCGFKSSGLFVMDASKRSKHSNAYFTGFGKSKRVVLYDTLIEQLTPEEIESVLGHELGHFKKKHTVKRLCFMIPIIFAVLYLVNIFINVPELYTGFGFTVEESVSFNLQPIGLFLFFIIFGNFTTLLNPLTNHFSRRDEFEADKFAKNICGTEKHLSSALVKLNKENLSELTPPKIYSIFNYSHPPLLERITALEVRKN